ncbi:DUF7845 domain-containing protein [Haladaptatus sp. NG-SE-30]
MSHVASAPHELEGNLVFVDNGLTPYWALSTLVLDTLDGGTKFEKLTIDGEEWDILIGYQKGGVAPREEDHANERLYEWRLAAYGEGQRKATYLIQPRFSNMRHHETGHHISTPFDHIEAAEGVNVRLDGGSNLEPDEYRQLLPKVCQRVAAEVGDRFNPRYFSGSPHEFSNITAYERYLRLRREMARKLIHDDGIFMRLLHLYAFEKGTEMAYQVDNTEIIGYNHRVLLPRVAAKKLAPGHRFGKQLKHYHPKYVRGTENDDDPLFHPKLGALFKRNLHDGNAVPWSERHHLTRELEETLVNILAWDSIPTQAGSPTFVPDDHFQNVESDIHIGRFDDPTPQMEASQEAVLVRTMTDLTDTDLELLTVLATNGGQHHVTELLGNTDIGSMSTIYRALKRLDGLLENENGNVRFISEKLKQDVHEIVTVASEAVETAAHAAGRVLGMDPDQIIAKGNAFNRWLKRYAVDYHEAENGDITLKIQSMLSRFKAGQYPYVREVLACGNTAWMQVGRSGHRFENATVEFADDIMGHRTWYVRGILNRFPD